MKRLLLIGCAMLLTGCASQTASLPPEMRTPQLAVIHTLELVDPEGKGSIDLTRETTFLGPKLSTNVYSARGAITVSDDLGEWRFTYARTPLNGLLGPEDRRSDQDQRVTGIHGLGVALKNTTAGPIEIDWTRSVLIDAAGRAHPLITRGVNLYDLSATTPPSIVLPGALVQNYVFPRDGINPDAAGGGDSWIAPVIIERLAPGMRLALRLHLKSAEQAFSRTFTFAARHRPPRGVTSSL